MKINSMTFRLLLISVSSLFFAFHANAATECMFMSSYSVDLEQDTADAPLYVEDTTPPLRGYKELIVENEHFLKPSTIITSTCNPGQDGQQLLSRAGGYTGPLDRFIRKNGKNILLYETTIQGLYYSVNMFDENCPELNGDIPPAEEFTLLTDIGDDKEKVCLKTDPPFFFNLSFYIGPDYRPVNKPINFVSKVLSGHGEFMLSGSRGDKDEHIVTVNSVKINGQLKHIKPNCPTWDTLLNEMQNGLAKKNLIVTAQHRGDFTDTLPENSLGAFHNSYDRCRANVETDVRSTSDNKLVVFHDFKIGKMLEPTYDPRSNTGPNELLSNITLEQLKKKNLVNVTTRAPTTYTVPTVDEMLDDYINYNGQSLLYLETKSPSVIMPTALALYNKSITEHRSDLLKRVILKVNMATYPSPDLWKQALINAGIPSNTIIMIDPVITPNDAKKINELPDSTFSCLSGDQDTKAICAVRAWATAPVTLAPMVSVLIKDSSDFINTTTKQNIQGKYEAPATLASTNAKNGTVAQMVSIIKELGKSLEIFSAIPDYMFWKDLNFYTETVYDANIPQDISVRNAFYNNDSSCCYQVSDKLKPSPIAAEVNDYRMNLGWLRDIGANVITADDTDSINAYYSSWGELDKVLTPSVKTSTFEMQSLLSWQLKYAYKYTPILADKGQKAPSGYVFALYNNDNSWAWTYMLNAPNPVRRAGYYDPEMAMIRMPDGRVRIFPFHSPSGRSQCLWSDLKTLKQTWTEWRSDCATESSLWQMEPSGNGDKSYNFINGKGLKLTWEYSGKLYYAYSYGWVFAKVPPELTIHYYWKIY